MPDQQEIPYSVCWRTPRSWVRHYQDGRASKLESDDRRTDNVLFAEPRWFDLDEAVYLENRNIRTDETKVVDIGGEYFPRLESKIDRLTEAVELLALELRKTRSA